MNCNDDYITQLIPKLKRLLKRIFPYIRAILHILYYHVYITYFDYHVHCREEEKLTQLSEAKIAMISTICFLLAWATLYHTMLCYIFASYIHFLYLYSIVFYFVWLPLHTNLSIVGAWCVTCSRGPPWTSTSRSSRPTGPPATPSPSATPKPRWLHYHYHYHYSTFVLLSWLFPSDVFHLLLASIDSLWPQLLVHFWWRRVCQVCTAVDPWLWCVYSEPCVGSTRLLWPTAARSACGDSRRRGSHRLGAQRNEGHVSLGVLRRIHAPHQDIARHGRRRWVICKLLLLLLKLKWILNTLKIILIIIMSLIFTSYTNLIFSYR